MTATRKHRRPPASHFPMLRSWLVPATVVFICCTLIVAGHAGYVVFSLRPAREFFVLVVAMNFLVYCWIRGCSQLRMDRQIVAIAAFVAVQAFVHQLVR